MIVTNNGAFRYLTFGKVSIPIRLSVHLMTDDLRHMSKAEHREILKEEDIDTPGGMDARQVLFMAMSVIQMAWYEAEGKEVPYAIRVAHEKRLDEFCDAAENIRRNGPPPKQHRQPRQMEIPGTPEPVADPREILS